MHAQLERTKIKTLQQRTVASSVIWVPRPDKQALEQRHVQSVQLVDIQIKSQMWTRARFVILARRPGEQALEQSRAHSVQLDGILMKQAR